MLIIHIFGIEVCHPDTTGKFSEVTNKSLIELCSQIVQRYNLSIENIIRHYDVTGKYCPLYHVNNPVTWVDLLEEISKTSKKDASLEETAEARTITMQVDGIVKQVLGYIENGVTYVKLRDLAGDRITIDYNGMPILVVE